MVKGFFRCYDDCITKKNQAKKCSDHRTISHTRNIVAFIISKRWKSKIEEFVEDQFQFQKGKGTKDATGLMRITSERVLDVKVEMCLCFIDWQKVFVHVDWATLLETLKILKLTEETVTNLQFVYRTKSQTVPQSRGNQQYRDWKRSQRGHCITPTLFNEGSIN